MSAQRMMIVSPDATVEPGQSTHDQTDSVEIAVAIMPTDSETRDHR